MLTDIKWGHVTENAVLSMVFSLSSSEIFAQTRDSLALLQRKSQDVAIAKYFFVVKRQLFMA